METDLIKYCWLLVALSIAGVVDLARKQWDKVPTKAKKGTAHRMEKI